METYVNFTPFQYLLYYFAVFIGLAPFSVEDNSLRPAGFLRKSYAVILVALSSFWIFMVYVYSRPAAMHATSVNEFVFATHLFVFVGWVSSSLLTLAFESGQVVEIWNRMNAIRDELKHLGVEDDPRKNWRNNAKIIATNSVVLLMRVINNVALNKDDRSAEIKALFWFGSILTSIHFHNTVLIFVYTIICIGNLFGSLNKKLQGTIQKDCHGHHQNSWVSTAGRKRRIADQSAHRIAAECESSQLSVGDVEKIAKLHGELCELVDSTTKLYTIPTLFAILQHFSRLLTNCYSMYTHVFVSHYAFNPGEDVVSFVEQLVARTVIAFVEFLLIAHACTTVRRVGNATKTTLHRVWNELYPEELRDEFLKFSLQLLQRPVAVAAFGFFHLDYSYLYKILCAMVAYFIIMIQLDSSQPNPGT